MMAEDRLRAQAATLVDDLVASLAFLTRFPVRWLGAPSATRPDFRRSSRLFPLVGALVGLCGGVILAVAGYLGAPPLVSAALAVAATMLATGGLHEDGLSDTFDGFGGGATPERKLEIMRDSRIGSHGAAALVFSIFIRTAALGSLTAAGPWRALLVLVAAEAVSRAAMMRAWHDLPPARADGLAHDTGPPDTAAMLTAQALALVIAVVAVWPAFGLLATGVGILLSLAATYILILYARSQIGGRTGDTLGACQQIAVVFFIVGVASTI